MSMKERAICLISTQKMGSRRKEAAGDRWKKRYSAKSWEDRRKKVMSVWKNKK